MASKRKRPDWSPSDKGSSSRRKLNRQRSNSILSGPDTGYKRLSQRSQQTRVKALHVLSDLRRNPDLTLTEAAKNRDISLRSVRKYLEPYLKQDRPGVRIQVTKSDRERETLNIPSTKPDVRIPIRTKGSKERYLVGEWLAAINEAARGDFTRIHNFPKGKIIDGVRLPTGDYEVQRIIEAIAESEGPLEELYATAGAA